MLTTSSAPAPSRRFLQSSSQPSELLRWIGNAAIAFATLAGSAMDPASLSAQQAEPSHQPAHRVAIIDVGYIFKNLPAIKAQVARVKDDLEREEADLKQKRDTLKQAVEQLKTLKVGTPEYDRQEKYVATLESKMRLQRVHRHRALNKAEARLYYDSYQQIAAAVRAIATHNDIKLVLRFNSEEMDSEQNDSVVRGVMKNVVFHDSTIDMTDTVMRYLEQQASTSQTATAGNPASATSR